jgi:hypothetical protein
MNKNSIVCICFAAVYSAALPVMAADTDPQQCLECHEPMEDWAGMTIDEIVVEAKAPGNKRHKGHDAITDEEMKLMIATLMPDVDLE